MRIFLASSLCLIGISTILSETSHEIVSAASSVDSKASLKELRLQKKGGRLSPFGKKRHGVKMDDVVTDIEESAEYGSGYAEPKDSTYYSDIDTDIDLSLIHI
eukprot:TRINITY_DN51_c0_g1_i3.p1 TRINITY_DN51_c0_g1~~TRINITY_DN51_c0_g1_i3.p1  ORF type:complete len:103 (+),score=14.07 TRINITY_DN51_c0_g1_i3:196-504(+)